MSFYRGDPNRNYPIGKSKLPPDYRPEESLKFGSTADGANFYNPEITMYYNSSDELVMVDEVYGGVTWRQTISGTGATYSGIGWTHSVTYSPWEQI